MSVIVGRVDAMFFNDDPRDARLKKRVETIELIKSLDL